MRFLVKASMPVEGGNALVRDPNFGKRIEELLGDIQPETVYFTVQGGQRTVYLVTNVEGAHQLPAIGEPLWLWLNADVEFMPILEQADMQRAAPVIEQMARKYPAVR
jgi:hypothetical protein